MDITKPVSIKEFDFTPYGRYWDLKKERGVKTDKYEAYMTIDPHYSEPGCQRSCGQSQSRGRCLFADGTWRPGCHQARHLA